ncbi:MAG TPA: heme-binding protein, partial [Nevskiaceae bacterium]|nr:heme-binding protein [Nevskiaceae bacterium]
MRARGAWLACAALLASCGGGGGLQTSSCDGHCADSGARLEIADVQRVLAQSVNEAKARGAKATIAVVDRVGNVLSVYRMSGAAASVTIDSGRGVSGGLEQVAIIPDSMAAISKALTGAYLSSEGNAFSTRTASQIVQEHFLPQENNQPSGPLFGVQFSSLPCSDLSTRYNGTAPSVGPQRAPLGLSADPGGFPLYKNGALIGGVGVISDARYGLDLDISDTDRDADELIALAGTAGYAPPDDRRADRITADGKTFRYSDAGYGDLAADPANAPALLPTDGATISVAGYFDATQPAAPGLAFGTAASGIRPATGVLGSLDGFVLVDAGNAERYPARDATDAAVTGASKLLSAEVQQLLASALDIAHRARAQIRRPLGSSATVSISVVDTYGQVLGIVRSRDAQVFGIDVSLQKARTAAFFSNTAAAADLAATPDTTYFATSQAASISAYLPALRTFLGQPNALAD